MIIGRETLDELGFIINFEEGKISWNDMRVDMKDPTLLDNKENIQMFALQAEPDSCQEVLGRAIHIMSSGRTTPISINQLVETCHHLDGNQKFKLKKLLNKYEGVFDGTLGDWDPPQSP